MKKTRNSHDDLVQNVKNACSFRCISGDRSTFKMDLFNLMNLTAYNNKVKNRSKTKVDLLEIIDFQKPNARLVHFCDRSTKKVDQTNPMISIVYGTKTGPFTKTKMDLFLHNNFNNLRRSIFLPLRGRGKVNLPLTPSGRGTREAQSPNTKKINLSCQVKK